jgi:hypothetical protein
MNTYTQKIIDHSIEYAKDLLTDTGQCYPFGAYVDNSGIVHPLEFEIDKKNVPNNETVISGLKKYCEAELQEHRIKSYGITYEANVQLEADSDNINTIAIDIVDISYEILPIYYFPYTFDNNGIVEFGDAFAVKR